MKIKHFAGYGTVEVTRLGTRKEKEYTIKVFRINGNHEWGLEPHHHDVYTIQHWLKRWLKGFEVTNYWTLDEYNWCNHEDAIKMVVVCRAVQQWAAT